MSPPTLLAALALVTLALTLWWGYSAALGPRPDGEGRSELGTGVRPVERSMPSPATALGGWVGDASVACPHCGAVNRVSDTYCAGCRAQLSPEWPAE